MKLKLVANATKQTINRFVEYTRFRSDLWNRDFNT